MPVNRDMLARTASTNFQAKGLGDLLGMHTTRFTNVKVATRITENFNAPDSIRIVLGPSASAILDSREMTAQK